MLQTRIRPPKILYRFDSLILKPHLEKLMVLHGLAVAHKEIYKGILPPL